MSVIYHIKFKIFAEMLGQAVTWPPRPIKIYPMDLARSEVTKKNYLITDLLA